MPVIGNVESVSCDLVVYSSPHDDVLARQLVAMVAEQGYVCQTNTGDTSSPEAKEALASCHVAAVLMTPQLFRSQQVMQCIATLCRRQQTQARADLVQPVMLMAAEDATQHIAQCQQHLQAADTDQGTAATGCSLCCCWRLVSCCLVVLILVRLVVPSLRCVCAMWESRAVAVLPSVIAPSPRPAVAAGYW